MSAETQTKLTYEDYLLIPNDGRRHEIIDGEHYVNPSPVPRHQIIAFNIELRMGMFLLSNPIGRMMHAPLDIVLTETDIVQPDIIYISRQRLRLIGPKNIGGTPELVVEILSTNRRYDEITKRKLYERTGVSEYWIVDPELETIKIYRRGDSAFVRAAELSAESDDILTTPLLPGFELKLTDAFSPGLTSR